MDRLDLKRRNAGRRAFKVRAHMNGSTEKPRLSVHISNLHISAQIIDDSAGRTLAYVSTVGKAASGTKTERAESIGEQIAAAAKKAKIKHVTFDRGRRRYHGRIKALADAARKEGLEF